MAISAIEAAAIKAKAAEMRNMAGFKTRNPGINPKTIAVVSSGNVNSDAGRPIWVATAHFDKGFKRASALVPVHAIDPDIDVQREYVRRDLEATGKVESLVRLPVTGRVSGRNFAGDRFFTDGTACLLVLEPAPGPATTP